VALPQFRSGVGTVARTMTPTQAIEFLCDLFSGQTQNIARETLNVVYGVTGCILIALARAVAVARRSGDSGDNGSGK
jgi:hypothetical protein